MHHIVTEDVVISGIGGSFPQSSNISQFKDHLLKNHNLIQEGRWKSGQYGVTNLVGKIPGVESFDNSYFGIHQQQSQFLDPMARVALERCFEALIDAGVNPHELKGKNIGCFMGAAVGENDDLFLEENLNPSVITGVTRFMMPNRISYWLDITGPSQAYDSNWLGGMDAIRTAYEAIKTGECESAIVGSANLLLHPEIQWYYNDMGVLSTDGSTRSFDANAHGYARSDGIVVMFLQKASEARRSYASIVNVMTRFDGGTKEPFIGHDVDNLAQFIEDFYQQSNVDPRDVEFVEAYGCALKETDKKELEGLEKVYCKGRENPLLVGSVKSNTGHSEASAVLFSVVKVLIAMESGTIPANIQFGSLNTEIGPLVEVVTENRPWGVTYAAVNALGLNAYYGHLLLKANPKTKQVIIGDKLPRLVLASTRTEAGIKEILNTLQSKKELDQEYIQLVQQVFSQPIQRHIYRGYTILGTVQKFAGFEPQTENKRPIWFVYPGLGGQWSGMMSDMMKVPVFANSIHKCHRVLEPKGLNLIEIMSSGNPKIFDVITNSFVAIAAFQIALTDVLTTIGIKPDGIIGHSVGEVICAYADNCFTAEQLVLAAYYRGLASVEANLIDGRMAAVGLGYQQIKDDLPASLEVACHNSADSCTISGPVDDIELYSKELKARGVFVHLVNTANIAYHHSRYTQAIADGLDKHLRDLIPERKERSSKWISTCIEESNWGQTKYISYDYFIKNLRSPVLFEEGLKHVPKDSVLIEIGPHGLLQAILKKSLPNSINLSLAQRGSSSGVEYLLSSLGKLYLAGLGPDISKLYPQIEYPVSRGTDSLTDLVHWDHSQVWRIRTEKIQSGLGIRHLQINLNSEEFRNCSGYQVHNKIVLPCSFYMSVLTDMIGNMWTHNKEIVFEDLSFKKSVVVPRARSIELQIMIQKGTKKFEILSENDLVISGRIYFPDHEDDDLVPMFATTNRSSTITSNDLYGEFRHRGHKYSGDYKSIKSIDLFEEGSVASVQYHKSNWAMLLEALLQQYLLLEGEKNQNVVCLKHVDKIILKPRAMETQNCQVETFYEYSSGWLFTRGIEMEGIQSEPFSPDPEIISCDSIEFVPFVRKISNMDEMINVVVQLMLQNFGDSQELAINVVEVESGNQSILENVERVLQRYEKITPNFVTIEHFEHSLPLFIFTNDLASGDLLQLVANSQAFLLSRYDETLINNSNIVQICLFTLVLASSDEISVTDLLNKPKPLWVVDLESALIKNSDILLACSTVPVEGILSFAFELSKFASNRVNFCFALRGEINKIQNDGTGIVQQIIRRNLKICVLMASKLGGFLRVPLKFRDLGDFRVDSRNLVVKNTSVHYFGLNLKSPKIGASKVQLGTFDYSGNRSRRKVMGIGHFNKTFWEIVPDPILAWDVPKDWTLEDAATVPLAYISAYYCLFDRAKLKSHDKVLIHSGCTSIGLAAISLALKHGCTVFTTVQTSFQRCYLKQQYGNLRDLNILEIDTFEELLIGGVDVIIIHNLPDNCLKSALRSLRTHGRLIQIDPINGPDLDCLSHTKNISQYWVSLDAILAEPDEVKHNIKKMMINGIKNLSVRPLYRTILDSDTDLSESLSNTIQRLDHIGKILVRVETNVSLSNLILDGPLGFMCDRRLSYLIYGGIVSNCIDVLEWLVLRGAQKVIIALDSLSNLESHRRIELLKLYFGVNVTSVFLERISKETIVRLVSETGAKRPIHAIFTLPVAKGESQNLSVKAIKYFDEALTLVSSKRLPKAVMVNFVGAATGLMQSRSDSGQNACNVQWEEDLDFEDTLYKLDEIMTLKLSQVIIRNNNGIDKDTQETTQALIKKLPLLLPTSEDMVKQAENAPEEPDLMQLQTLGPLEIRELAPVFILPGLSGQKECREMAYELLCPTFCAVYPKTPISFKELAAILTKKIVQTWPKGAYNIIGISWGGSLMIEIARLLAKRNGSLHLYFIDGAPDTLQSTVRCLGEDLATFETNLLSRILGINDSKGLKSISSAKSWESRINIAFDCCGSEILKEKKTQLGEALLKLRGHLEDLLAVKSNGVNDLIPGQIHLIRPQGASQYDNCGLVHYCKQMPQIVVMPGDHLGIINCAATVKYLNENYTF